VGALTDRLGGRTMFPLVAALTIAPTLFVGFVDGSLAALLIGGFFLGIGGTSFAIGVPPANPRFPPPPRAPGTGVYGAGWRGPPAPSGHGDRGVRGRHGRYRDRGVHHAAPPRRVRRPGPLPPRRRPPRGVRGGRPTSSAELTRLDAGAGQLGRHRRPDPGPAS